MEGEGFILLKLPQLFYFLSSFIRLQKEKFGFLVLFWAPCTCYSMFPLDLVFACYYDMSSSVRRCFMRVLCLSSVVEFSTEFAIFLSELQRIIIFNLLICHSIGQSIFSCRQLSFIYRKCMPYCCSELLIIDNKKTVECVCVCVLYFYWL